MRKEILKDLTEDEIEFLKILSYRLNTQDQRCTAYPVWKVCDVERQYGVSGDIADGYCIFNVETEQVYLDQKDIIDEIIKSEKEKLDVEFDNIEEVFEYYNVNDINISSIYSIFEFIINVLEWKDWVYCGYLENHKTYATFITEKEAANFIEDNKYKYSEDVYVYVESSYGNMEMMMLIDIIKKLKF